MGGFSVGSSVVLHLVPVGVATAAVVVAFAFADIAVVAFAFADIAVVAAVAVLALLLLEEVRFVRTGDFWIRFEFLRKG